MGNNIISIKGARVHNLKNISLDIPRDKFVVITGVSGSGKSSLAFDTLYAEGQRRYVESLSAYARQFLGRIAKPEVDNISGIPPAIAIEQKVNTKNPRSTVGTSTEIYDYIKLLYARIGRTISPISGNDVKKHSVTDVVNAVIACANGTAIYILAPFVKPDGRKIEVHLDLLLQQGFSRLLVNEKIEKISDISKFSKELEKAKSVFIVIDRFEVEQSEDFLSRVSDSVQTAFNEGHGECIVGISENGKIKYQQFSNRFDTDGISFEEPNAHMFSFNSPAGACPQCEGFGLTIGIDEGLVIPNKNLSIYDEAVVCWKGEKMSEWKDELIYNANKFDFPIHKPYYQLSQEQKDLLWSGNKYFGGINGFFKFVEENNYKIQYRVLQARYRGKTVCPACKGTRLKKEASYVKVGEKNISQLVNLPIIEIAEYFKNLKLNDFELSVSKRLLYEINSRLDFLINVGLGYLTINRTSSSLSGGESQRINIATSLGSSLIGSLYILDEPSIGLHSRDTDNLITVLKNLNKIGNSVIIVEHDESIMKAADIVIDMGPFAGRLGGEVIYNGSSDKLEASATSLTAKYLTGKEKIAVPKTRRKWNNFIEVCGARENNLKNISVKFPLNALTVITGVSGSGKSSLAKKIFFPSVRKLKGGFGEQTGNFDTLKGDLHLIKEIEYIDQNPIGKSSRSNPVTYIKAYDEIRTLFANQKLSKYNGYKPSHFSFNVDGGRCDECQGDGHINVEMQFMADVELVCESCNGKRFKEEILEVTYRKKNIYDILEMTVDESIEFFSEGTDNTERKIVEKIKPLADVGLGYVKLGQSSSTLSGGESQRVKLASFLGKDSSSHCLFLFDEPTTGLHFNDIKKLLDAFNALVNKGHSMIIIEHNLDVIKSADWIIDLGPEGGEKGGYVVFEGTPEDIVKCEKSYTGRYLRDKL